MPIRILLDNGILSEAEFVERAIESENIDLGSFQIPSEVSGYRRKALHPDSKQQVEIDALFTIGRLIREKSLIVYTSRELQVEAFRRTPKIQVFNALRNCEILNCPPPLERSKFRQTIDFNEYLSKGGKKSLKNNEHIGDANQIPFLKWLQNLNDSSVELLIDSAQTLRLTRFEVESLRNIKWFQSLCKIVQSPENYPDVFHAWTAERNQLDVFLTLEKKLPNTMSYLGKNFQIRTQVLRPTNFLNQLGISKTDDVPVEFDKFYSLFDYN